jgi:hypothetical protein
MASPVVIRALALLAPALLITGSLAILGRPEAGGKSEEAARLERVTGRGSELVILGNSKAGADIDEGRLAVATRLKVADLHVDGTNAGVWTAVLANRVYAAGHQPRVVIVYAPLLATLTSRPQSDTEQRRLLEQLDAPVAAVEAKVFGGGSSPFWNRVNDRRAGVRAAVQHFARDVAVGLAFAGDGATLRERGRATAEPAMATLFGTDAGEGIMSRARAIPVVEQQAAPAEKAQQGLDASMVPDLVAMVAEHGGRIVFVRAPLARSREALDRVDDATERGTIAWLNDHGAGWLDLREARFADGDFGDGIHMNAGGRDRLTAALITGLERIGALGDAAMARSALPRARPVLTRTGTPPTLPALNPTRGPHACGWQSLVPGLAEISDTSLAELGVGWVSPLVITEDGRGLKPHGVREEFDASCQGTFQHQGGVVKFSPHGESPDVVPGRAYALTLAEELPLAGRHGEPAWWVYPGTALRLEFPEAPFSESGSLRLHAHALAGGAGEVRVVAAGASVAVRRDGKRLAAQGGLPVVSGAWTVEIASPAGGPWLLIDELSVSAGAERWDVIGSAGRTVSILAAPATYVGEPPALAPLSSPSPGKGLSATAPFDQLGLPDQGAVRAATGVGNCSPVRVSEDGKPLPEPNAPIADVEQKGGGRYAHGPGQLFLSSPYGSTPAANGRTYTAALDPTRACRQFRWLYPGDELVLAADGAAWKGWWEGVSRLVLAAARFGDTAAPVHVRLELDGATVLDQDAPAVQGGPVSFPIAGLPRPTSATLRVSNTGAAWLFLTGASLAED